MNHICDIINYYTIGAPVNEKYVVCGLGDTDFFCTSYLMSTAKFPVKKGFENKIHVHTSTNTGDTSLIK